MGSLRIGIASWSLGLTPTMTDLEAQLDQAADLDVKGVQLWCVDYGPDAPCVLDPDRCGAESRKRVRQMIEERGLAVSGVCAQLAGPTTFGGLGEEEGLTERVRKTQASLELSVDLGGPIVTTHVGVIPEDRNDSLYGIFLRSCGEIARHATDVGASFAFETGQETAETLKQFIEDLDTEGAKVNFDPANMLKHGVLDGLQILAPYIVHTHAKDRHPDTGSPTVGEGAVPWDEYLAALKKTGYDGWYAIEDESGADVIESIKRGKAFLDGF